MRILLVEDEGEIARRCVSRLSAVGFIVEHVANAESALDLAGPEHFAAMVVDLGLPDISGMELIRRWRERGHLTPIIIMTARDNWQDKVAGLNNGADDFVVKPIRSEELVARLHALIRRTSGHAAARVSAGSVQIDPNAKAVWLEGEQLDLTQIEYRLLYLFVLRAGHILAQSEILDHIYPMTSERDLNTIEVHIGRLRRKIGKSAITTVRGLGYRFER
jgi:two-component system, OmpR family, response regulator